MDVYGHIFPHQHAEAAAGLADLLEAPEQADDTDAAPGDAGDTEADG